MYMQRAKRILALVLAFTLVASFCVTGAAADDTVQGDYVTVNVETGSYRNTLTVNVYGPEGNWLETLTSERARTSDCEISINLIDTEYLMEDVDFNGDGSIAAIAATAISSDRKSYNIRWNGSGGGGQSFTLDVYLRVNPTGTPETPEGTYNEGATVGFRAYTPQMLKLLYCENPALVNDSTEITGVEMFFRREFGYGQSEGLADINREEDYRNTELSNATGLATPSNVSEIRISYRNGETEGVASIEAGDLSFVYHSGAGHYYSIESRNHGINVVYFYNETGSHSGNNFFQYAVRFVETGNSLGTNMPNDPTYTDGAVNNYSFVNWEQGSWNGSGDPFYSTTVVNDDLTVFAMKVGWNDHSTTQIWVMNPDEEFMELVADKAGVSRTDINKSSIKIRVYDDDEQTNENYPDNGWVDAYDGYYLVWNHRGEGGTGSYEEGHLEPDKIDSVTVYFQLNDSDEVQEVNLGVGADGELGKSLRGNENILQLKVRDDGYTPTYYNVGYSWTFSGTGTRPSVTLPVDSTSYDSEAEAKAAVDTTYTSASTASVEGGTWTFSGWNNGTLNGTTVTFSGTWTFTPDGGGEEPENPPKPGDDEIPGILGAEFRVNVVCETNGGHSVSYPVMANAEGTTRYMVSDVAGDAESGYSCTVTFTDIYLNTYLANNTGHTDSDTPDDASVTLSWDAAEEAWELDPADNTATFYVECETETEPEGPEKPTVSDLDLEYVVRIECVNAENTHGSDSVDFSLRTDTQIGEPYLEDGSWKVTVTVDGRDYLAGYATDTWSGVEHELAPGETAEKTFEAVYDGTGWTVDATPAVTFRVVCDTTGDEGDEPAITGFSKRLVTSEPTWADFSRLGISYPDARGVIHVDRYDSVTLLYTLTVSGDEGAKYLINDPDAMLVTFRDGVASVWEPATDVYGEFTGTVPSPHTYYVVKTFSWADIRDSGGYLSNTAIVEPMDGTGGPDGGNGESSETVKVEIDGDWYPVVKPGRPSALTDEHVAYMIGYADGTVRPLSGITRAEVATIFFRLLTDEVRDEYWSQRNPYTDVAEDAWYNNAISTLVNMGIISGYSDGTFRPDAAITRAEFTKIAVSFFDYADDGYSGRFSDVSGGSWYATFVDAAADMGLIEGYGDGTFRPDAGITRAEACAIVNRTLGRAPEAGHLLPRSEMNTWSDNANANAWYYADIQEATNSHDYEWVTYGGERIENWTAKLAERDWADLEREWSDAHDAPGGEVMS